MTCIDHRAALRTAELTIGAVRMFRVRIDLNAIAKSISESDRRAVSVAEVRQLLQDSGFQPEGDFWIVAEPDLALVKPSEVLQIDVID